MSRITARSRLPSDWYSKSHLKLRHLQLLVAIDEHRSLHRAAIALEITQPAASRLLAEMEKMLAVPLFDRQARGIAANELGDAMIRRAQMILSELDEATEEVSALKLGYGGGVTIGAVGAAAVGIVVDTIRNIQKLDFDLQVTVTVDTSNTLIRMVQEAKLDFALCRIPDGTDPTPFFYEEIGDEQLSFICRKQHPLATARNITLSQLTDYGLILQHRGTSLRKRVDSLFMSHGFLPPRRVVNSTSTTLSLALVRGTDTLAVLPAAVAALYSANGHYKTLQLKQRFSIDPYGLVRRKDRPLSRSAQNALEIMQHVLAKKREKAT